VGLLFPWNALLTAADYFATLYPKFAFSFGTQSLLHFLLFTFFYYFLKDNTEIIIIIIYVFTPGF